LTLQSLDLERTWWQLFQKCVVRTKFDIYVSLVVSASLFYLCPLILLLQNVKLFGFPIFQFWAYLMKLIPEIWNLRFYEFT
jgi:hypothetical protein